MLKRILTIAAMAATLTSGPAFAGDINSTYGNTVRVTMASGAVMQLFYDANNTYTMVTPDGARVSGAWAIRGEELCTTPSGGAETCRPLGPNRSVGDTWTAQEADGSTTTLQIVAGRP